MSALESPWGDTLNRGNSNDPDCEACGAGGLDDRHTYLLSIGLAEALGINRSHLWKKIRTLRIVEPV